MKIPVWIVLGACVFGSSAGCSSTSKDQDVPPETGASESAGADMGVAFSVNAAIAGAQVLSAATELRNDLLKAENNSCRPAESTGWVECYEIINRYYAYLFTLNIAHSFSNPGLDSSEDQNNNNIDDDFDDEHSESINTFKTMTGSVKNYCESVISSDLDSKLGVVAGPSAAASDFKQTMGQLLGLVGSELKKALPPDCGKSAE